MKQFINLEIVSKGCLSDTFIRDKDSGKHLLVNSFSVYGDFDTGIYAKIEVPVSLDLTNVKTLVNTEVSNLCVEAKQPKPLIKFIKNEKGLCGVVLAFIKDGRLHIGWSKCNTDLDKFDKEIGIKHAYNRATTTDLLYTPQSVRHEVNEMVKRAKRYYKQCDQ